MHSFFSPQNITLLVLFAVVAAMIWGRIRSDVVALTGAAVLLLTGVVRPIQVQSAFASPAIVTLAALFVIAYAMELSGLLDTTIRALVALCRRIGKVGLWIVIVLAGVASAFLNNTPIVVLSAPVLRDAAKSLRLSPKGFLIPLSYAAVLGGGCTLIGTSTNLLVNDMAAVAGQPKFGLFDITPVGIAVAVAGGLYLLLFSRRLIKSDQETVETLDQSPEVMRDGGLTGAQVGSFEAFAPTRKLKPLKALVSLAVFVGAIAVAAMNIAPIAASAFAGAVLLILLGVITADEAYKGLRADVLMLIAGMLVLGIALNVSGVASAATRSLITNLQGLSPLAALIIIYGATLFATELLSNATVAVLFTPLAVSLAVAMNVSPRPFLIAVMAAGSAAFATPFGYQTNALVYQMGRYKYLDFVRVGLPLNLITWITGVIAIRIYFPF